MSDSSNARVVLRAVAGSRALGRLVASYLVVIAVEGALILARVSGQRSHLENAQRAALSLLAVPAAQIADLWR